MDKIVSTILQTPLQTYFYKLIHVIHFYENKNFFYENKKINL